MVVKNFKFRKYWRNVKSGIADFPDSIEPCNYMLSSSLPPYHCLINRCVDTHMYLNSLPIQPPVMRVMSDSC